MRQTGRRRCLGRIILCVSRLFTRSALSHLWIQSSESLYLWIHINVREKESTKGVSGTRITGQAKTKKHNPGQFVWHIEWMLAVHSFYHTFGLTAHSFSFVFSFPGTRTKIYVPGIREKTEKKKKRWVVFLLSLGPQSKIERVATGQEEERQRTQRMSGESRYAGHFVPRARWAQARARLSNFFLFIDRSLCSFSLRSMNEEIESGTHELLLSLFFSLLPGQVNIMCQAAQKREKEGEWQRESR